MRRYDGLAAARSPYCYSFDVVVLIMPWPELATDSSGIPVYAAVYGIVNAVWTTQRSPITPVDGSQLQPVRPGRGPTMLPSTGGPVSRSSPQYPACGQGVILPGRPVGGGGYILQNAGQRRRTRADRE